MDNYEKIIIKELLSDLKNKELKTIYSFHEKYRIGPGDLSRTINYLIENQFIEVIDNTIRLLQMNDESKFLLLRDFFLNHSPDLLNSNVTQESELLEINKPYLPNQELLDKSFFTTED